MADEGRRLATPLPEAKPGSFKVFKGREGGPRRPPDEFEGFGADGSSVDLWTLQELTDLMREREWLLEWAFEQFRDAEESIPAKRMEVRSFIANAMVRHYPGCGGSSTFAEKLAERDHRQALYELEQLESQRSRASKLIEVLRQQDSSLQTRCRLWEAQYRAEFTRR